MGRRTYKFQEERLDPETGELIMHSGYSMGRSDEEDDYIKVYRYLNCVFAFKGINSNLIPTLIEICAYMTYADRGQQVVINRYIKGQIANAVGVGIPQIDRNITHLKRADILRPISRGVYQVNPFVVGRGKWSDIKELRASFDFVAHEITSSQSIIADRITGETIAQITREMKKKAKGDVQVPGQLSLSDFQHLGEIGAEVEVEVDDVVDVGGDDDE